MFGVRKILGLISLVIALSGVAIGGFNINQSVAQIRDCGEACIDIEQVVLGFEVTELTIPKQLTVVLLFVFRNPSSLSASVVDLPFSVDVAGVEIAQGTLCCLPLSIQGKSNTEATGIIQVPFSQIPSLALNAIKEFQKAGALQYTVRGTVTLRGVFLGVIVPFLPSITRDFQKQGSVTLLRLP